ncbi:hypothetical protein IWZ03DRAFT_357171 [Phyllosticta citriasiana]|uniref:BTB domain-containing protein n=1 Tax=Phyllosticta citriasiana TaxID=595635 RepID=A0ABR1KUQ2_9PEZI
MESSTPNAVSEQVKKLSMADETVHPPVKEDRFSHMLSSRVIEVVVGVDDNKKTFLLHEDLLCCASSKMKFQLRGPFKEAQTGRIPDCEEDPALFAFFAEYLYRDTWLLEDKNIQHPSHWILLARLYTMGERLMAHEFQRACAWKFARDFSLDSKIADTEICQLLEVVTEIPEEITSDNLSCLIFWYTASKLSRLRKCSEFKHLLIKSPDLGRRILMWAADNTQSKKPFEAKDRPRGSFVDEINFY